MGRRTFIRIDAGRTRVRQSKAGKVYVKFKGYPHSGSPSSEYKRAMSELGVRVY